MPRLHTLTLALSLGLISTGAFAAEPVTRMSGEAAIGAKAEAAPQWRLATSSDDTVLAFRDLPATRIAELQKRNQRPGNIATQIGIARNLDESVQGKLAPLKWQAVEGGSVARIVVASPDALALRTGLSLDALPAGAELRFAGSLAPQSIIMVTGAEAKGLQAGGAYWSPMTDGDSQTIEVFVPAGVATDRVKLSVTQLSHLLTNSIERFSLAKAIGDSGACNVNAVCRVAALGAAYTNSKNSVARMVYNADGGGTYTCTGTLLNDTVTATQIPYFYTADHCISSQTEATSLLTFWGFESATCAGTTAAANTQLTGGAQYLYSDANTDASLLRLNGTPPAGAFFNGWNAAVLANNSQVLAIHHPSGDLKKSSLGVKMAQDSVNHEVAWTEGTTEGGSSGSGLFTSSANGYELRGGLYGGNASCANTGNTGNAQNRDWYSRLDVIFPQVQQYLAPTSTPPAGPTRDYTGAWYVPSESGWGLTAYQYNNAANTLFVMFFIYDGAGNAKWYEFDGSWTANDVRSGPVLQSNGPAWSTTFNPASRTFSNAGTATLTFTSATTATLTFTVNGVTRSASLQKL